MKTQLLKVAKRNQLVDMIYMDKSGQITKRRLKVIRVSNDKFSAFCFTKNAPRTFIIKNVLAILPVINREREVI